MRKFLDYSFTIIIVVIVVGAVFLVCTTVAHRNIKPYTKVVVQVTEPIVLTDTLGRDVLLIDQSISSIDSLVSIFNAKSAEIDNKYELLLKARENESYLLQILASIIAVILGVLSFLGIRSIKDIEEDVKESAQKIAKEKADESTTSILERMANSKIQEIAQNYYDGQYKDKLIDDIENLLYNKHINRIEEKLSSIKKTSENVWEEISDDSSDTSQEGDIIVNPNFSEEEKKKIDQLINNE